MVHCTISFLMFYLVLLYSLGHCLTVWLLPVPDSKQEVIKLDMDNGGHQISATKNADIAE